ncbi:MAG: hypothetical protein ACXWPX_11495 [Pseudobdellovibrio sp.]
MKNLKSILTHKKIDFTAIQIFISTIAIFFAGIVNGDSVNTAKLKFSKPVVQTHEVKSCEFGSANPLQVLNVLNLQKTKETPLCSKFPINPTLRPY